MSKFNISTTTTANGPMVVRLRKSGEKGSVILAQNTVQKAVKQFMDMRKLVTGSQGGSSVKLPPSIARAEAKVRVLMKAKEELETLCQLMDRRLERAVDVRDKAWAWHCTTCGKEYACFPLERYYPFTDEAPLCNCCDKPMIHASQRLLTAPQAEGGK